MLKLCLHEKRGSKRDIPGDHVFASSMGLWDVFSFLNYYRKPLSSPACRMKALAVWGGEYPGSVEDERDKEEVGYQRGCCEEGIADLDGHALCTVLVAGGLDVELNARKGRAYGPTISRNCGDLKRLSVSTKFKCYHRV